MPIAILSTCCIIAKAGWPRKRAPRALPAAATEKSQESTVAACRRYANTLFYQMQGGYSSWLDRVSML
jgi:hypothetical protein